MSQCKYAADGTAKPRTIRRHNAGQCICYGITRAGKQAATTAAPDAAHESAGDQNGANLYREMADTAWGADEWRGFIKAKGQDPDTVTFQWGVTSNPLGGYWNKLWNVRPLVAADSETGPAWPVIQRPAPVIVAFPPHISAPPRGMRLAIKCADTQIGFRRLANGTMEPFHDAAAMALFVSVCHAYQPDKIQILGDFLDLASQGRWVQEAGFAQTTQPALEAGYLFLASLRAACPDAEMVLVEGNHDKRMQSFIEANALAAFGLKRAGLPESWPVMSMPFLLRLDELNIQYVDAYPAATDWDNDLTRNIHGTKSNSKGSTTSQYVTDLPHLNTWAGHTHRTEITYRSVLGPRGTAVESYSANPGCLCRTDGAVPGTNSAITADGAAARIVENWQQGFGMAYYNDTESWPYVYRIRNGRAIVEGREFSRAQSTSALPRT